MNTFDCNDQKMSYLSTGSSDTVFVWTHGWGHTHQALQTISDPLLHLGRHILIDFPGFGASPKPATDWTITDYADFMVKFLDSLNAKKIIWIGHSFGCRVGMKLAALYPNKIQQMILMSSPGLSKARPLPERIKLFLRVRLFKTLKLLLWKDEWRTALRSKFGSADYKSAGAMRQIFMNSINENAGAYAAAITCPVLFIYGEKDTDTPPEIGERLSNLMPNATLNVLPGFDHYSILSAGQYQVAQQIKTFTSGQS